MEKESIDLLVLGMYSEKSTRRKGLALRGNASALYNRSACPTLMVPLSEGALARSVRPSDLALTAEEEEELASGSESESDEEEGAEGTEGRSGWMMLEWCVEGWRDVWQCITMWCCVDC